MDRYIDIKKRLLECANENDEIQSIIAIGSSIGEDVKADEYHE